VLAEITPELSLNQLYRKWSLKMNWDQIEGNWKQFKGKIKEHWGKLTDDHIDTIAGKREQLSGKIQESYGISKEEAEKQISDWERKQEEYPPKSY
jgi:uncharacterized protein YjbJ (UPF0337 family)